MNNIHIEAGPQRALRPMDRNTMISIADPTSRKPIIPLLPNIGQINCRAQAGKENNDCVPKKEDCKENPNEKSKTTISVVPAPPIACVAPAAQCTRPTESRIPVMRSRIPLATAPSNSNLQTLVTRPINLVRPTILSTASIRSNLSSMPPGPLRAPAAAVSNVVRSFSQLVPIENIDNDTNCFLLSEYAPDIYKYLHELEMKQSIPVNFLSLKNASLTANMRAILINWLINVHNSFQLCSETLYICVSIIDRYFAREPVSKNKIQLVGATALFVAAKFEEIYYPDVQEFVMICDRLYTKKDIIRMELKILQVLRFELGRPLPLHFLRRGSKAAKADGRTHMMAKYLCELSLVEYECSHWNPSQLAAAALYLSARMNNLNEKWNSNWNTTLEHYTHYSEKQVQKWASVICRFILSSETSRFQNCRKKYSHTRYMEISKSSQLQMPFIRQLATVANRPKASS